jgi:hypothetical protein
MSFFGFDTSLPEHKGSQDQSRPAFATNDSTSFGQGFQSGQNAGQEEDLAVYNWGDSGGNLLEAGDEMNDATFGDVGDAGKSLSLAR